MYSNTAESSIGRSLCSERVERSYLDHVVRHGGMRHRQLTVVMGLLLSPRARRALREVHYHSERILIAEFDSNPVTTVLVAYSPTNVSQVEDVELFYEQLTAAVRGVPAQLLGHLGRFQC